MAQVSLPSYREPPIDANGQWSRSWWRFFQALATITGGGQIPDLTTIIQSLKDLQAEVEDMQEPPRDLAGQQALMLAQQLMEMLPEQRGFDSQIMRLNEAIEYLLGLPMPPALPQVEAFITPALLNSWVYFGSNSQPGYYKDPFGRVHLRGFMKSGTIGNAIFTLPAGYRPPLREFFPVVSNDLFGACYVDSNGDVVAYKGSNVYFCLDGITFRSA